MAEEIGSRQHRQQMHFVTWPLLITAAQGQSSFLQGCPACTPPTSTETAPARARRAQERPRLTSARSPFSFYSPVDLANKNQLFFSTLIAVRK